MSLEKKEPIFIALIMIITLIGIPFLSEKSSTTGIKNVPNNVSINVFSSANQDWIRTWGEDGDDEIGSRMAIDVNTNNSYIVGTKTDKDTNNPDLFLVKYNQSGDYVWNVTWDNNLDFGVDLAINQSSGDIYVSGDTYTSDYDFCLLKINSSGGIEWVKTYDNSSSSDRGTSVAIDASGHVYIVGVSDFSNSPNITILKYDGLGNVVWKRFWDCPYEDDREFATGIAIYDDDSIYVTGYIVDRGEDEEDENVFLLKYDSAGDLQWSEIWGGSYDDSPEAIEVDSLGNIYITGSTESYGEEGENMFLVKFNSSGSEKNGIKLGMVIVITIVNVINNF